MKPKLQVALDHSNKADAIATTVSVGNVVDIIEVGTVLLLEEGGEVIEIIKKLYPEKVVIADTKCADAGATVAQNVYERGADWMTCICSATLPTMKAAAKEIEEVQVELYGDWTYEQAQSWLDIGIDQVIYHQSRDSLLAGESWGEKDLSIVSKLIEMGFRVSVTGGLNVDTVELFKGLNVHTFIAGRGIAEADDPSKAAQDFKERINELWED